MNANNVTAERRGPGTAAGQVETGSRRDKSPAARAEKHRVLARAAHWIQRDTEA